MFHSAIEILGAVHPQIQDLHRKQAIRRKKRCLPAFLEQMHITSPLSEHDLQLNLQKGLGADKANSSFVCNLCHLKLWNIQQNTPAGLDQELGWLIKFLRVEERIEEGDSS